MDGQSRLKIKSIISIIMNQTITTSANKNWITCDYVMSILIIRKIRTFFLILKEFWLLNSKIITVQTACSTKNISTVYMDIYNISLTTLK